MISTDTTTWFLNHSQEQLFSLFHKYLLATWFPLSWICLTLLVLGGAMLFYSRRPKGLGSQPISRPKRATNALQVFIQILVSYIILLVSIELRDWALGFKPSNNDTRMHYNNMTGGMFHRHGLFINSTSHEPQIRVHYTRPSFLDWLILNAVQHLPTPTYGSQYIVPFIVAVLKSLLICILWGLLSVTRSNGFALLPFLFFPKNIGVYIIVSLDCLIFLFCFSKMRSRYLRTIYGRTIFGLVSFSFIWISWNLLLEENF
jgi:hypothetical protein